MPTAHIESSREDIANIVLMPGDPLRAKYIAEKFLTDVKIVNQVRNMVAYTGFYKGKRVTVFPSGMGIPSIGIYAFELYKFYDVDKIIRIGTCGSNKEDIKILDIILADRAYSTSSFAKLLAGYDFHDVEAGKELTNLIYNKAVDMNRSVHKGRVLTSEVFDVYVDHNEFMKNFPSDLEYYGSEMEAFALFTLAKFLDKEAACLLTVVDSCFDKRALTSEERQKSLNDMIGLALESII
ncbi:MAG TPA: purine-nucleoside phosphorylase [Bacilli bacterium]|nr:purine-nucleoside phosphorylase [Bacilli bacterium]